MQNNNRKGLSVKNNEKRTGKRRKSFKTHKSYLIIGLVCFVLVVAYIIVSVLHPVGVIEYVKSMYYSVGSGKGYDVALDGGKPIYTTGDDNRYYVVSAGSIDCFNKNGKSIFNKSHSFTSPVVKHSETRYLYYGQGETTLYVNSFKENLKTLNFKYGIIAADISDSGVYAVAAKSDGYSSALTVFSKRHEKLFEWFSSEEIINSIEISKNGNLIALSTMKVVDGKYISEFIILNYNSANPIYRKTYTDDIIYHIFSTETNSFCVSLSDNIEFINFKKGQISSYKSEYSVNIIKFTDDKIIAVRSVAANQDESTIEIYKKNGELIHTFKVENHILDFSFKSNRLFLLGTHDLYKYNIDGELLSTANADYDLIYIEAISSTDLALIKNSSITKFSLTQLEEK